MPSPGKAIDRVDAPLDEALAEIVACCLCHMLPMTFSLWPYGPH